MPQSFASAYRDFLRDPPDGTRDLADDDLTEVGVGGGTRQQEDRAPSDLVAEITKQEPADHGAGEADGEDFPHHQLVEVKLGREIGRGKRDDVHVEAIEERDDP